VTIVSGLPAKTAVLLDRNSVALYTDSAGIRTDWGSPADTWTRNQVVARNEGRFDLAVFLPNAGSEDRAQWPDGSLRLVGFRYSASDPRRVNVTTRGSSHPFFRAARGIDGQEPELPRAVIDERRDVSDR